MNVYLAVNAVLFFAGCVANLWDLGREHRLMTRIASRSTVAMTALLQGALCAWALYLLCGRWSAA